MRSVWVGGWVEGGVGLPLPVFPFRVLCPPSTPAALSQAGLEPTMANVGTETPLPALAGHTEAVQKELADAGDKNVDLAKRLWGTLAWASGMGVLAPGHRSLARVCTTHPCMTRPCMALAWAWAWHASRPAPLLPSRTCPGALGTCLCWLAFAAPRYRSCAPGGCRMC